MPSAYVKHDSFSCAAIRFTLVVMLACPRRLVASAIATPIAMLIVLAAPRVANAASPFSEGPADADHVSNSPVDIRLGYGVFMPGAFTLTQDSNVKSLTVRPYGGALQRISFELDSVWPYFVLGISAGYTHSSSEPVVDVQLDSGYTGTGFRTANPQVELSDFHAPLTLGARIPLGRFALLAGSGFSMDAWSATASRNAKGDDDTEKVSGVTLTVPIWARLDIKPICGLVTSIGTGYDIAVVGPSISYPSVGVTFGIQTCDSK
jgi:hypothetical protein